jgi:pilus assembly protein CpaF
MNNDINGKDGNHSLEPNATAAQAFTPNEIVELISRVHSQIMDQVEADELQRLTSDQKFSRAKDVLTSIMKDEGLFLPLKLFRQVANEAVAEISGFGPIQPLLEDPTITEIMVNGPNKIYIERDGKLSLTDKVFKDDAHVLRIIERIIMPLGRRIDEGSPMVDARLPDGSRVNAIIRPLAVDGPMLTVRKFARVPYEADNLIAFGTFSPEMIQFLKACVEAKITILVTGGTGSGKTTTLNVLSSFIPNNERIVTIEDAAELQMQQDHVVRLESRPSNLEGRGEVTIRQLVRNSLRMRPDRIIVGEVRGGEALDMLQAMNTGHEGSISTLHTNSPKDALSRLETMVLMAGTELPSRAIREQIASATDLIVHQSRFRDGSRKVTSIAEVQGMEGDIIVLQEIFIFDQHGVSADGKIIGEHKPTGLRPQFMRKLAEDGIELPVDVFRLETHGRK